VVVDDPRAERLQELVRAGGGTDPRPLLSERSIFGNLGDEESFVRELEHSIDQLQRNGVRVTLADRLSSSERPRR
jgi:fructuronate reductase/mannitol 2-dehydrogenase